MVNKITDTQEVIESLKNGKVGIFPTDTAFGMGCRIDEVSAVERVYKLRKRPSEKALLALVSSIDMAKEYVEIDEKVLKFANKYWPGGLTVVLKCYKDKVPSIVRAGGETLAVRVPDHLQIRDIIEKVGVPIVAPSANKSGKPTPFTIEEVDENLQREVDFVLPGVCTMKGVSTIVDATSTPIKVLRQGVVKFENFD